MDISNDSNKVLWRGKLHDASLTFVLPPDPTAYCSDPIAEDEAVVVWMAIPPDSLPAVTGHIHIPAPVEVSFVSLFASMMTSISETYLEHVMQQKQEASYASHLH